MNRLYKAIQIWLWHRHVRRWLAANPDWIAESVPVKDIDDAVL